MKSARSPHHPCYRQIEPPELNHIFTLTQQQPYKMDFWCNTVCFYQNPNIKDIYHIVFKSTDGYLTFLQFDAGCLIDSKKIKILKSVTTEITTLNIQKVQKQVLKKGDTSETSKLQIQDNLYLFIGYQDGIIDVYEIQAEKSTMPTYKRQIQRNIAKDKKIVPVTNVKYYKKKFYLIVAYSCQIVLIQNFLNKNIAMRKINLFEPMYSTLNIEISNKHQLLFVYNQMQGLKTFNLQSMILQAKIQDSIKILKYCTKQSLINTQESNQEKDKKKNDGLVIYGGTDNSFKFIDYDIKIIHKIYNLKSYISCIQFQNNKNGLIWIGTYDGVILCYQYSHETAKQHYSTNADYLMFESFPKHMKKICDEGIKNILIFSNILMIIDTEQNLRFYDIIKFTQTTQRASTLPLSSEEN